MHKGVAIECGHCEESAWYDMQGKISERKGEQAMSKETITFETDAQAAIYENEMKGQISDGHWENTPGMDWRFWCDLTTLSLESGGSELGVSSYWVPSMKPGMSSKALYDCVGYRMLAIARGSFVARELGLHPIKDAELMSYCIWGMDDDDGKPRWKGAPKYMRDSKNEYYIETCRKIRSIDPVAALAAASRAIARYKDADCRKDTRRISAIAKRQHGDFSLSA